MKSNEYTRDSKPSYTSSWLYTTPNVLSIQFSCKETRSPHAIKTRFVASPGSPFCSLSVVAGKLFSRLLNTRLYLAGSVTQVKGLESPHSAWRATFNTRCLIWPAMCPQCGKAVRQRT